MSDFRTPNTADLSLFEEQKKIILDECKTKNWDQYGARSNYRKNNGKD